MARQSSEVNEDDLAQLLEIVREKQAAYAEALRAYEELHPRHTPTDWNLGPG